MAQLGDWLVLLAIQLGEAALHLIHRQKNIIRVALAFGGLFFLGFIVYLVFKRSDTQAIPTQATVQAPVPLV